jgi:uncharacterized membrane protein
LRKTIRAQATIPAPADTLFACLADYERADVFIEGLEQLHPIRTQTTGEGAQFAAVLRLGMRTLRTTIEITSVELGRRITWSSAGDDGQSLTFELQPVPEGTTIDLAVAYEEPGGIAGALIAPFVEQTVERRAITALERLRKHVSQVS